MVEYGRLPLAFEENRGQADPRVSFLARGEGYTLLLAPAEAVLMLREAGTTPGREATPAARAVRLRWLGADPASGFAGERRFEAESHYLHGADPTRWRTHVPTYGQVRLRGIYPGIDLLFYGREHRVEHDFILAPGADPRHIRFALEGADRVELDAAGDLVLHLASGALRLHRPVAYQEIGGRRREVASSYRLLAGTGGPQVSFALAAYDRTRPLVVDPVLSYSTYLGGNHWEEGLGIAVDDEGNAYVTGLTFSPNFPVQGPHQPLLGVTDTFVAKFDPDGHLLFSTYLGGTHEEQGEAVAVDASGIYLAGWTTSADFPRLRPIQAPQSGIHADGYAVKLELDGTTLVYSITFGGSGWDSANSIAVDDESVFVGGYTASADFPTRNALQPQLGGARDALVLSLDRDGALAFATYLGGSGTDMGEGIAVDRAGRATVTGGTESGDFPLVRSPRPAPAPGDSDAFVARLTSDGRRLIYSIALGGSSGDWAKAVAVEPGGRAVVVGTTGSADFPVRHALQTFGGETDAFIARLSPTGVLTFATWLGGRRLDWGEGVGVDRGGAIYAAGGTESTDFPLVNPFQDQCLPVLAPGQCAYDGFVAKLAPANRGLAYSSYLGGTAPTAGYQGDDSVTALAVDPRGDAYVTGWTYSSDFPAVRAFQPEHAVTVEGENDAFVTRIRERKLPPSH